MTGQGRHATIQVPSPRALERLIHQAVPLGVSINDDWANLASDVADIVEQLTPLFGGIQEGFRRKYRADLGRRWGVKQKEQSEATAGVAVFWDRKMLSTLGHHYGKPGKLGSGWIELDHTPGLRPRGVVWRDLQFRRPVTGLPPRFRLASWHRDPWRDHEHWPEFDGPAIEWLRQSPIPAIVFQDSNEHGGPSPIIEHLGRAYAWHADGNSIDGAIIHRAFHAGPVVSRPRETSDHDAAVIPLGIVKAG